MNPKELEVYMQSYHQYSFSEMQIVSEMNEGESFGELALLNDAPRAATIECTTECHFAIMDKGPFK